MVLIKEKAVTDVKNEPHTRSPLKYIDERQQPDDNEDEDDNSEDESEDNELLDVDDNEIGQQDNQCLKHGKIEMGVTSNFSSG